MICWWCHWGWPKRIADIFMEAVEELDGDDDALMYGPAHIVWADENFDFAQKCIDMWRNAEHLTDDEARVVRRSLERLAAVDDKYKNEPEDYDGENPQYFPPPADWTMIKI